MTRVATATSKPASRAARAIGRRWDQKYQSSVTRKSSFGGLAVSLWPYVVPRHATVWSAASDGATLRFVGVGMLVILPIILGYLGHAYWVFRGKTVLEGGYGTPDADGDAGRRAAARRTELHLN